MANIKITDLPLITGITINDVIPIVDVDTIVTSKVTIGDLKNYLVTLFTGGTVSGDTEFTNGLTANTISATTYFNLPTDNVITLNGKEVRKNLSAVFGIPMTKYNGEYYYLFFDGNRPIFRKIALYAKGPFV